MNSPIPSIGPGPMGPGPMGPVPMGPVPMGPVPMGQVPFAQGPGVQVPSGAPFGGPVYPLPPGVPRSSMTFGQVPGPFQQPVGGLGARFVRSGKRRSSKRRRFHTQKKKSKRRAHKRQHKHTRKCKSAHRF